ncbi:MAG: ferritin-like domain-containing protein [Gemmatimonadota bacterium]
MKDNTLLGLIDTDVGERLLNRRSALTRGVTTSAAVAVGLRMASVPVAVAALSRDAFAQGGLPAVVVQVLNFALTLEYLESEFYNTGVGKAGLIPLPDRAIFTTIQAHENAHVQYLLSTLASAAVPKPTFDFTAGNGSGNGPYADVFSNYDTFKAVAQAFEDTGVRAYKGQAGALQPYPSVLTAALTIHSVEARHASEVRRLRGNFSESAPNEGWITRNVTDIPGTAGVYAGEERSSQLGIDLTSLNQVGLDEITEAFDEPLSMQAVLAIVDPFIV